MSDYISKSALIDFMIRNVVTLTEEAHDFKVKMIDAIKNQPTVDEKELIRKPFERVVEELKEAREKQVAKKPILISDGDSEGIPVYDIWECPNCGEHYEVEYDDYDYCPNCGQAIDKSEMG